jgi:hypothetical protein
MFGFFCCFEREMRSIATAYPIFFRDKCFAGDKKSLLDLIIGDRDEFFKISNSMSRAR